MTVPAVAFMGLAVLLGVCTLCRLSDVWLRIGAFLAALSMAAVVWQISLGEPRKPVFAPQGSLVAYKLAEPVAIYVWLLPGRASVPVAYELPWSERMAAQLFRTSEQARKAGQPVQIRRKGHRGSAAGALRPEDVFVPSPPPLAPKSPLR